jgi:hypothetical protein
MSYASPGMGNRWHISRTSWRTCSCTLLSPEEESTLTMREAVRLISCMHGWGAQPDAARNHWRLGVKRNGIPIYRDARCP